MDFSVQDCTFLRAGEVLDTCAHFASVVTYFLLPLASLV